jgi:glucosamine--fructose-6-phosphate aminotransferase (isomerizing)
VILLHAGPENAVAATKTYTASLAVLALFSTLLAGDDRRLAELLALPEGIAETLSGISPTLGRVERYRYIDRCSVIGRGYNYATAFEVALKVTELTRVVAESYSSADFRHGPIAMVQHGFPVIIIAPQGSVFEDVQALSADLLELKAEQLIISDDTAMLRQANLALPLPKGIPEWLSPLVAVLPGQLFGMALAQVKGLDPDQPMGLHKVTETY